jgi:pyruvate/2-oxoglutarate dehydrogenase complex dihydrolipoamide dehydrogenase (E3) component
VSLLLAITASPATSGVVFDQTINLGNILTIVFGAIVWAVTIAIAWTRFGGRMDMLEFRIKLMEDTLKVIAAVLEKFTTNEKEVLLMKTQISALETNYSILHKTLEDLRRGKGFINDEPRRGLSEEY